MEQESLYFLRLSSTETGAHLFQSLLFKNFNETRKAIPQITRNHSCNPLRINKQQVTDCPVNIFPRATNPSRKGVFSHSKKIDKPEKNKSRQQKWVRSPLSVLFLSEDAQKQSQLSKDIP